MSTLDEPTVRTVRALLDYTGVPNIPNEKADELTPEERKKGGKPARKVISGVKLSTSGTRKGRKSCCWRAYVAKSGVNAKEIHPAFSYDCSSKEEAAYLASMAHRLLKPSFAQFCREGTDTLEPAGPGHYRYFLNNIWALWKFCRITTYSGDYIVGAVIGGGDRRAFVTDLNEFTYRNIVQAPFFNRRTVDRRKNYEPVQPWVSLKEDRTVRVEWVGLSEIVLGTRMEIPPGRLIGIDYRKAALLGQEPEPIFRDGQTALAIPPQRFNAVASLRPDLAHYHPYGVISMGYQ